MPMYLEFYKEQLGGIPSFLKKYLKAPSLVRLQKICYFCGMDYASKNIYDFREWISRYDHSLTVALFTYRLTQSKKATIAGLIHDVATPCFSHVIDYMNQDFEKQESTEEFTEDILLKDTYFLDCLKKDHIAVEEVMDFKKYPVVDNDRPKLCVDRLDGIILTGIGWTKNITLEDIQSILEDVSLYTNSDGEEEVGFSSLDIGKRVVVLSQLIDEYCHSSEDNYMMSLLGDITKLAIHKNLFSYEDLYSLDEEELFDRLNACEDKKIKSLLNIFYHVTMEEIPTTEIENLKRRIIHPIVAGERI